LFPPLKPLVYHDRKPQLRQLYRSSSSPLPTIIVSDRRGTEILFVRRRRGGAYLLLLPLSSKVFTAEV